MNRNKAIEIILSNNKYTPEEQEIIKELQNSITEIEVARSCFNNVNDKNLIDISIHKEDEAKSRYIFFLEQAKNKGITVNANCMVEELNYYSKW